MADGTKIEWTDATVNAVNGCSVCSPGCLNCYAMRLAGTRMKEHPSRAGLTVDSKAGPVWTGEVRLSEKALMQPLSWKRPRKIFWNAHGDLFHENVPDEWIDKVFAVCALTPQHTHQILTKRSGRMRTYLNADDCAGRIWRAAFEIGGGFGKNTALRGRLYRLWNATHAALKHPMPLPNVWLGVSVEDQRRADERIPDLLATPAAVRFLSCEPLLGPVDLTRVAAPPDPHGTHDDWKFDALAGGSSFEFRGSDGYWYGGDGPEMPALDWVIVGGESGPGARPMHPDWARSLRDQCAAAGVAFHFKQWGEWAPYSADLAFTAFDPASTGTLSRHLCRDGEAPTSNNLVVRVGKRAAGRHLDGVTHDGVPG